VKLQGIHGQPSADRLGLRTNGRYGELDETRVKGLTDGRDFASCRNRAVARARPAAAPR
jgi:hypothetical protein